MGNGSRYGYEGDLFDNVGTFACRRTLTVRYGQKGWQKMRNHGVAHRSALPCGTRLGICNPADRGVARRRMSSIVDRGARSTAMANGTCGPGRCVPVNTTAGARSAAGCLFGDRPARNRKVYYWPLPDPQQSQASRETVCHRCAATDQARMFSIWRRVIAARCFSPLRDLNAEVLLAGVTVKKSRAMASCHHCAASSCSAFAAASSSPRWFLRSRHRRACHRLFRE